MTSSKLADILSGYRWVGDKKIQFSPDEVYDAGSLAQKDICNVLRLLEQTCYHVGVIGQERYQYPAVTITGATAVNPSIITAVAHGFQTGDTVVVGGVLGTTSVNGRWTITKLTADTFSVPILGNAAYTSGGIAYHALYAAIEIRGGRQVSPAIFPYDHETPDWVELHRQEWADPTQTTQTVPPGSITKYYEIYDEPIVLGFAGVGNAAWTSEFRYYRQPFPHEDLSATVNPLIGGRWDSLLIAGTEYWMHQLRSEAEARQFAASLDQKFQLKMREAAAIKAKDRLVTEVSQESLRW